MSDSKVLLIIGVPSLTVAKYGEGGIMLTIAAKNHPADGVRLSFERGTLREFLNAFQSRLSLEGKSEIFPGQVQMIILRKAKTFHMVLVAWRDPSAHPNRPPPELVFDLDAAKKLYREIAKVSGMVVVS